MPSRIFARRARESAGCAYCLHRKGAAQKLPAPELQLTSLQREHGIELTKLLSQIDPEQLRRTVADSAKLPSSKSVEDSRPPGL